jgi:hypothetical protein
MNEGQRQGCMEKVTLKSGYFCNECVVIQRGPFPQL